MSLNGKYVLLVSGAVVVAALIMGAGLFFTLQAKPMAPQPVVDQTPLPSDFTPKALRESILGTVLDTEARYGFFTIMDASGIEKAITISTSTRILQTAIQHTQEGEEVRRIEREVNIADVRAGTEVEISAYIETEGGLVDTVRFTSSTTIDLMEYLKMGEPKKGFLEGEVTSYDMETGVLMFKRLDTEGALSDQDTGITVDVERVMIYELTDRERPSLFHVQTPKVLADIEVGDMVRIFIRSDEVTQKASVYAVVIIPTL